MVDIIEITMLLILIPISLWIFKKARIANEVPKALKTIVFFRPSLVSIIQDATKLAGHLFLRQ
jgi:hypothetical protein